MQSPGSYKAAAATAPAAGGVLELPLPPLASAVCLLQVGQHTMGGTAHSAKRDVRLESPCGTVPQGSLR